MCFCGLLNEPVLDVLAGVEHLSHAFMLTISMTSVLIIMVATLLLLFADTFMCGYTIVFMAAGQSVLDLRLSHTALCYLVVDKHQPSSTRCVCWGNNWRNWFIKFK